MDTLSVVRTGMAMQNARLAQSLGAAVARTAHNQQEAEGALAVNLIESARVVVPSVRGYSPGQFVNVQA